MFLFGGASGCCLIKEQEGKRSTLSLRAAFPTAATVLSFSVANLSTSKLSYAFYSQPFSEIPEAELWNSF